MAQRRAMSIGQRLRFAELEEHLRKFEQITHAILLTAQEIKTEIDLGVLWGIYPNEEYLLKVAQLNYMLRSNLNIRLYENLLMLMPVS
jgi:hypothetical protein